MLTVELSSIFLLSFGALSHYFLLGYETDLHLMVRLCLHWIFSSFPVREVIHWYFYLISTIEGVV